MGSAERTKHRYSTRRDRLRYALARRVYKLYLWLTPGGPEVTRLRRLRREGPDG
jgi:hypothetical protein